jgi:hypothetical protein
LQNRTNPNRAQPTFDQIEAVRIFLNLRSSVLVAIFIKITKYEENHTSLSELQKRFLPWKYSITVTPSPTRPPDGHILAQGRRGSQEAGEAHQGGHWLHHFTPHPTGTPEQGRDDGRTRWDGEESELLHMIEKKFI